MILCSLLCFFEVCLPWVFVNMPYCLLSQVFKDGNGYKAAWFSAKVMDLKDGKAYVSYTDLSSAEGESLFLLSIYGLGIGRLLMLPNPENLVKLCSHFLFAACTFWLMYDSLKNERCGLYECVAATSDGCTVALIFLAMELIL